MLERLRNIGISAHIDAGKTTLAERVLFYSGRIHKMHNVRSGDMGPTMDSGAIERRRGITIASAATRVEWLKHAINLIDTPGHVDFTIEVERSLRVLDGAVMVLCAASGVQSQTVTVNRQMLRYGVARIAVINKMDLDGADPLRVLEEMRGKLGINAVPIQIPIGKGRDFEGIVDLLTQRAHRFGGEFGEQVTNDDVPPSLVDAVKAARESLIEALALTDESTLDLISQKKMLTSTQIMQALRRQTLASNLVPVVFTSAQSNTGVQPVLDAVVNYLPSPLDRNVTAKSRSKQEQTDETSVTLEPDASLPPVAMAFKTVVGKHGQLTYLRIYQGCIEKGEKYESALTGRVHRFGRLVRMHADRPEEIERANAGDIVAVVGVDCANGDTFLGKHANCVLPGIHIAEPVMQLAVAPESREDLSKLSKALDRLRREDPTFRVSSDPDSGETLIAGMGRLHLDVAIEKIQSEFDCPCIVGPPQVAYKQRPTKVVEFNYKRDKQSGGPGQYGHVIGTLELLPLEADETFEFESRISGGRIPSEYIPSIEKGFREQLVEGPLGKYEVIGVKIVLLDGSFHEQDSSDLAFQLCARDALRKAILPKAEVALVEPLMQLDVDAPKETQGPITALVTKMRGTILGCEQNQDLCQLKAEAPLAELFNFSDDLRTLTKGHGTFSMSWSRYEDVPFGVANRVLSN
ncbi:MAG: elongation factor G [Planctomycetota bacterium]